jgi:hypothetical protein
MSISSHPQKNTPVRNDNSRSLRQEATITRCVIESAQVLFYFFSLRYDCDFYIWPDDRVNFGKRKSMFLVSQHI